MSFCSGLFNEEYIECARRHTSRGEPRRSDAWKLLIKNGLHNCSCCTDVFEACYAHPEVAELIDRARTKKQWDLFVGPIQVFDRGTITNAFATVRNLNPPCLNKSTMAGEHPGVCDNCASMLSQRSNTGSVTTVILTHISHSFSLALPRRSFHTLALTLTHSHSHSHCH